MCESDKGYLKKRADVFYEAVLRWNYLVRDLSDTVCGLDEIRRIIPVLSDLVVAALALPHIEDDELPNTPEEEDEKYEFEVLEWDNDVGFVTFEEQYNHFKIILYPYKLVDSTPDDQVPCGSSLSDAMDDITRDLGVGKVLYERGDIEAAVDLWRDSFYVHWGKFHAFEALFAMENLLADKYLGQEIDTDLY